MANDTSISNKQEATIRKFMKERDLPEWFRGLSQFQIEAADSLLISIRDDCEQATSHRVRDALRRIGIEPLVSPQKIKFVMHLSRGNDIAFLWFLMELYYRSHCVPKNYSVNEQIFITVIAHLDTIPTLRELDKLLPKQSVKQRKKKIVKKMIKYSFIFPYFQKQRRPMLFGKSLIMNEVDNFANFSEFDKYRNPNYVVLNESNRWFADYELKKSQRIAKGIIDDRIEAIFENEYNEKDGNRKSLIACAHHQTLEVIKESMANELKVARRKACENHFDVKGYFKNQSYKRVMTQLNEEIAKAAEHFNKLADDSIKKGKGFPIGRNVEKEETPYKSNDESLNLYNFGHDAVLDSKCVYFNAPTTNKPYKFNYNKIFDLGAKNHIKDAIKSSLNAESSGNASIDNSRAVRKCCRNIWAQEVKNYNANYKKQQKYKNRASCETIQHELQFDQPPFDPRNKRVMESMLYQALKEIKKNKKYVLASLPDAHKFPVLREWIKNRYGMVFTRQDKRKEFKRSKIVFQVVRKNALRGQIPRLKDLSRMRTISYGCKEYLLKKTNYLREKYYDTCKENLLKDTRIYWAAVRPYQCPKGPPRNEFFAYLPARKNDIHLFRPWKGRECVHAKDEWDGRQRNKKKDGL